MPGESMLVAPSTSNLKLSLIGTMVIVHADGRGEVALTHRKARALLAYLAMTSGQPQSRESLLALLWPSMKEADARNNLRVVWSQLTGQLGQGADGEPYLIGNRQMLQFNPRGRAWLDVAEFETLIRQCEAHGLVHAHRSDCPECHTRLRRLADLYRGEFLSGLSISGCPAFEEWQFVQSERLHLQALDALHDLAQYAGRQGHLTAAEQYARRQVTLDPLRERAHRQLMRLMALQGRRAEALLQYETCARVLALDLGLAPDAETQLLRQHIATGEITPMAPPAAHRPGVARPAEKRHTLPHSLALNTAFVGRDEELARIGARMTGGDYRLISIVGPGGVGKTRLSTQLARDLAHHFPDGVGFVPLTPLQRADEIPAAVLASLEQTHTPNVATSQSLWERTLDTLRDKQILLVLDNAEHLLVAATTHDNGKAHAAIEAMPATLTGMLLALLRRAPGLQLLVTSRERLRLQAEDVFTLAGLSYPDVSQRIEPDAAGDYAAIRLFCERAYRVNKAFKLSATTVHAVARICQQVRGNPLGIELAATWISSLSAEAIHQALLRGLDLLSTDMADIPAQHRSMRAVFDRSWSLLDHAERRLLGRLSVFRGGFYLADAMAITDATPAAMTRLQYKSLVQSNDAGRLDLHELLRQFAYEHLARDSDPLAAPEAHRRHSEHYLRLVASYEPALRGEQPRSAQAVVQSELDNIREAWQQASARADMTALLASVDSLRRFYALSGHNLEGERAYTLALSCIPDTADSQMLRQRLCLALTDAMQQQGKLAGALANGTTSLRLAEILGDARQQALSELLLGRIHIELANVAASRASLERALALARGLRDLGLESEVLRHLGTVLKDSGVRSEGEAALEQAHRISQALGNVANEQAVLLYLGVAQIDRNDVAQARAYLHRALDLVPRSGARNIEARVANALGFTEARAGNLTLALSFHERSRSISHEINDLVQESHALHNMCAVCRKLGRLDDAVKHGQESLRLATAGPNADAMAFAWVHLGYAWLAQQHTDDAHEAFSRARDVFVRTNRQSSTMECALGLAEVALRRGDLTHAMTLVNEALAYKAEHTFAGADEPEMMLLTCHRVLAAAGDPRAETVRPAASITT